LGLRRRAEIDGESTLRDVADHAGVSPMTVSRVITGAMNVREETRERVMSSVKLLNYRPNIAARSLARQHIMRVAIVYSNPSVAYLSALLLGVIEQTAHTGCEFVIERFDDRRNAAALAHKLVRSGVDGVILPPSVPGAEDIYLIVAAAAIPCVVVGAGSSIDGASTISINDFAAAFGMTRHLVGMGHERIGFIKGAAENPASRARESGYRALMREAGLAVPDTFVAEGSFTYRSGIDCARALLDVEPGLTAIFASNDDMAAGAIAFAQSRGLNVPEDLSVAGFDDTSVATSVWPALTTVHQPVETMGRLALRLIETQVRGKLDGIRPAASHELCDFSIVSRQSCAVPRPAA
jgi:LacI family transcriptional regulator